MQRLHSVVPVLLLAALPAPADAAGDVLISGAVVNVCTLTPGTGTLGSEADGTTMSTEGLAGVPATIGVVATGTAPSLTFSAPTLTTPPGFTGTPATTIQVSDAGGVLAPYTSGSTSTRALGHLLDTVTVRSKVVNATGFAAGVYTVRTTVTCQQN